MLSDRKKTILSAVVDCYIDSAQPISSKEIQEKYLPDCSTATIRNELSALESMGYLVQPHVSAGRIPSKTAFRYYVSEMLSEDPLSQAEIDVIDKYFTHKITSMEELVASVTRVISEVTNYTSVVVKEDLTDLITTIKLLDLANGKLLVVIVTDARVLSDGIVDIPEGFSDSLLKTAESWLNKIFVGKHIGDFINFSYPFQLVNTEFEQFNLLFKKIIDVLKKVSLANGMDVETYGANNIFQHSEYADVNNARSFLNTVEHKEILAEIFTDVDDSDGALTIKIGSEDNVPDGCSVVTTHIALGDNVSGNIGVIGPVRMNYRKVVTVLNKICDIINCIINKE